ncbi:thiamine-binding protein [bacterium]|nr:thiamine-binding protein [bacterium]
MPCCNVSLQIVPMTEDQKVYPIVDQVIQLIHDTGLPYRVGPMETTIEGELEQLLPIVQQSVELAVKLGAYRVLAVVKVDYKPGGVTMKEKMASYE